MNSNATQKHSRTWDTGNIEYQNDDIGYVVLSLTYFNDAEGQDDPVVFQKMSWEKVKSKVRAAVLDYMKKQDL